MGDVYKKALKEYEKSNGPGGCYADKIIEKLENTGAYPLTVDEELSHVGAFRKSLPKDNGAQSLSDESLDEMINSGKDFFCDLPGLPSEFLNYESKIFYSKN